MTHGENMKKIKSFFENLSVKWRIAAGIGCLAIAAILGYTALSLQNVQLYAAEAAATIRLSTSLLTIPRAAPLTNPTMPAITTPAKQKANVLENFLK
jgi:hypothetical protein